MPSVNQFHNKTHAIWLLVFGTVLISFAPVLVRATDIPPTTLAFYRMFIGGAILAGSAFMLNTTRSIKGKASHAVVAAGLIFAFDLFFWHRSIHLVGPGLATILAGLQVFVLAIVGVSLFDEKLSVRRVIAVPLAFVGLVALVGFDWSDLASDYRRGIIFGLATAACYAVFLIIMRWVRQARVQSGSPIEEVAIMSLICAGFLMLIAFLTGESLVIPNRREALLTAAYAVTAQTGWLVIISSIQRVSILLAGLILLLEPSLAFVWDIVIFDRPSTVLNLAGAALVLLSIYLCSKRHDGSVS